MDKKKYWDDRDADIGRYHLVVNGKEIGELKDVERVYRDSPDYVKRRYKGGRYLLDICIYGSSYNELLKADNITEAKAEFERWLADYYNGRIAGCKMAIKHYKEQLEYLKED